MNKILVTGGCGYIGSHTMVDLMDHGFDVISVDNLMNATEKPLDGIFKINGKRVKNYQVDLTDDKALANIFAENTDIIGVVHFAALKAVGESVEKPLLYYRNNLIGLLNLLDSMTRYNIPNIIFSSSCSVYGNTTELPVTEMTPKQEAESPYGRTKQMGEDILWDLSKTNSTMNTILLRYFNPAGAHESALIGESPANIASNLIPVITEAAANKRPPLTVFGTDYPTRDGSCIRDYIHVMDLAHAHTLALQHLLSNKNEEKCTVFNLGIGKGVSVLEALSAFEKETNVRAPFILGERRPGDVIEIYADFSKAAYILGWQPKRSIGDIMRTAWEWEKVKNQ
ncbi:MAG: UDP-glucose 4-epimerase GalE [Saprospiraceae bacterium]|jgi:UDP-glucose 4-epimerase